jgi:hypothetical protein
VLLDKDWGRFESHRHGLSVPLPEGVTWKIDDRSSPWLDALHVSTQTRVRARSWNEAKPMSPRLCEERARQFDPGLPVIADSAVLEDQSGHLLFAPDFSSRFTVGLGQVSQNSDELEGYVLGFGAAGKKCVAMVVIAKTTGPKASVSIAEHLALGSKIVEDTHYVSTMPSGALESPNFSLNR